MAAAIDGNAGAGPMSRRPPNTPFRQQTLKAWRPILTPAWVIATFTAVGCAFIPIGAFCLVASQSVVEVISKPYDETCCEKFCDDDERRVDKNPCTIKMTVRRPAGSLCHAFAQAQKRAGTIHARAYLPPCPLPPRHRFLSA